VNDNGESLWQDCASTLRPQVTPATWMSVFHDVRPLSINEEALHLGAPSKLVKKRLEQDYLPLIDRVLDDFGAAHLQVRIDVSTEDGRAGPADVPASSIASPTPSLRTDPIPEQAVNPRHTFESFVVGDSNRLAFHAANRVVADPGRASYNPLFIHGPTGVGKTHLLEATVHHFRTAHPNMRALYTCTEHFIDEFYALIRDRTRDRGDFRRHYRQLDLLVLDNLDALKEKESVQDELFSIFEALHPIGAQIVLAAEEPPDAMRTLDYRLKGRFKQGLECDIQSPEFETRVAILSRLAEEDGLEVPLDVLEYIASQLRESVRELEGALNRLSAHLSLYDEKVTFEQAVDILRPLLRERASAPLTAREIMERAAPRYGFTVGQLCGVERHKPLVLARQKAMYAIRELTKHSYPDIGNMFGGRDHTTVIHAVRKISDLVALKGEEYQDVSAFLEELSKRSR